MMASNGMSSLTSCGFRRCATLAVTVQPQHESLRCNGFFTPTADRRQCSARYWLWLVGISVSACRMILSLINSRLRPYTWCWLLACLLFAPGRQVCNGIYIRYAVGTRYLPLDLSWTTRGAARRVMVVVRNLSVVRSVDDVRRAIRQTAAANEERLRFNAPKSGKLQLHFNRSTLQEARLSAEKARI